MELNVVEKKKKDRAYTHTLPHLKSFPQKVFEVVMQVYRKTKVLVRPQWNIYIFFTG